MGTRGLQKVINKAGELKISQYNQWDSYPSGQGVEILQYLRSGNLEKYQENLEEIPLVTDEQLSEINGDENWKEKYPYMSRDCGSRIHKLIEEGLVEFVAFCDEKEARAWCEGFYTINFQENTFHSEFHGRESTFPLDGWDENDVD